MTQITGVCVAKHNTAPAAQLKLGADSRGIQLAGVSGSLTPVTAITSRCLVASHNGDEFGKCSIALIDVGDP